MLGAGRERDRIADRVRDLLGGAAPDDGERSRWSPTPRAVASLALVTLAVIAVTVWWFVSSRPQAVPVTPLAAGSAMSGSGPGSRAAGSPGSSLSATPAAAGGSAVAAGTSGPAVIVVDVAGKVVHPGLYRLPPGSRVWDALEAAGGASPGVSTLSLNLAAPLQDGQQVVVGVAAIAPAPAGAAASPGAGAGGSGAPSVIDLNTATLDQLETLPGVGPVLAQHVLDWRDAHGRFDSINQLNDVSGIGDVKFADLRALVSV